MMVEKYFKQVVKGGYITGIILMIIFLPHSKFMLSLAQFIIAGAWILERFNFRKFMEYIHQNPWRKIIPVIIPYSLYLVFSSIVSGIRLFIRNKPALIFGSIYLLHVAGLLYTTDFDYALKDLRTKLPILILPLYFSTSDVFGKKQFYWLIILFAASVVVRTLINSWNLMALNYVDIRDISRPISHVRLALQISLAMFYLGFFIIRKKWFTWKLKSAFIIGLAWLIVYLIISRSTTGLVVSTATFFILMIILIFRSRKTWLKYTLGLVVFICLAGVYTYVSKIVKTYYSAPSLDITKMDRYSAKGNLYSNYPKLGQKENGNYIYLYIQWDELKSAWNKRSKIKIDSFDRKNQMIQFTLIRYLASKNLRKDEAGVEQLTDEDIRNIENGTANVYYQKKFSIRGRIYEFLYGYDNYHTTGDATGSSAMQRLEYWKASAGIIHDHWLTGVGTGDMNEAFQDQYKKMNSKLAIGQRWRSHNQFLSIFVGFGVFGFLWFLFAILYPPLALRKFPDIFFLVFFIIAMISMIPEDTLESQAGVTFFAFFYSFLLFAKKDDDPV